MKGWVDARTHLDINFTTFEEFVSNQDRFIERVVSIYGGSTAYFDKAAAITEHGGIDYHRRKGSIDEWRTRLSPGQVDAINALIPDEFWDLFGWEP